MAVEKKRGARRPTTTRAHAANGSNGKLALRGEQPETLLNYYREMVLIRRFEQRAGEMYTRAKIGGYCHLNLGEEATIVGLMAALEPRDYLLTNYREHGYALARGIEPGRVMAELFGKETGTSRGRGGSMHIFDAKARLLGGYAIVGGQLPIAVGVGLAIDYRDGHEVVMVQMGDATTNIGAFHESLNLAQLWHLPVVFAIVNNQYGMGTPPERASAEPELYKRACAYRMASERVDGNDVLAVREAARRAVRRAREEHEPTLLEAVSFRLRGHSVVDPARYRSREEVERGQAQDPIPAFRRRLVTAGIVNDERLAEIEADVERVVDQAVAFADESADPRPAELFTYAYATPAPNEPRQFPGQPLVSAE
ncbi:MAG TPA: pyruvate dehydrogenase (acetyl-transferring) E1 component subunit alpha [Chloroflexota bacterium]|nr:pyruvate dehydrogenase (acetyl-transferring) E1 component subunit alpha [Chloroflexota bacterium]